ncbi:MAG: hypothetical protein AAGT88_07575 [Dethiobacter sp.]
MVQSIYDGIIKRQDAIGDLGRYARGEDGTIYITKEIVDSLEPVSRRGLREAGSSFGDWEEVISYYTGKNFKNTIDYKELLKGKRGFIGDIPESTIKESTIENKRI